MSQGDKLQSKELMHWSQFSAISGVMKWTPCCLEELGLPPSRRDGGQAA